MIWPIFPRWQQWLKKQLPYPLYHRGLSPNNQPVSRVKETMGYNFHCSKSFSFPLVPPFYGWLRNLQALQIKKIFSLHFLLHERIHPVKWGGLPMMVYSGSILREEETICFHVRITEQTATSMWCGNFFLQKIKIWFFVVPA